MQVVVGISELRVSKDPLDTIITYSLGSCLGISIYDPTAKAGGIVHCMLPSSSLDPVRAKSNPCMFIDTGISLLLQELMDLGASRESMIIKAAGASSIFDEKGIFKIGERNYLAFKSIMAKMYLSTAAEDVRGNLSRTMTLYLTNGTTTVRSSGKEMVI